MTTINITGGYVLSRLIVTIAVLCQGVQAPLALAQDVRSGERLLVQCRQADAFARAVDEGRQPTLDDSIGFAACSQYLHGFMDALTLSGGAREYCVPATYSIEEVRRVFIAYSERYPVTQSGDRARVLVLALVHAYCP